MKLIAPREITAKIMTMIEEANEYLIIISPYNMISKWPQMKNCFENAIKKNIKINYYIREDGQISFHETKKLGINPIPIDFLHAKIYMNENEAIITSKNLHFSSDIKTLDIGLISENEDEYKEIYAYYERFIKSKFINKDKSNKENEYDKDGEEIVYSCKQLMNGVNNELKKIFSDWRISNRIENDTIHFKVENRSFDINYEKTYREVWIIFTSILTHNLFEFLKYTENDISKKINTEVKILEGDKGHYSFIQSQFIYKDGDKIKYNENEIIKKIAVLFSAYIYEIMKTYDDDKIKDIIYGKKLKQKEVDDILEKIKSYIKKYGA